jgi:hypothetical protein
MFWMIFNLKPIARSRPYCGHNTVIMRSLVLHTFACSCAFLFTAPLSFAQINDDAAASIQRELARTIVAELFPDQAQANPPHSTPPNPKPPSLEDLGISPEQAKGNPQEQARLNKRSHMLKIHQRLGLITTAPLIATVITGTMAGGRSTSSTNRDLHAALGSATAGLYLTTAYFSIFAPKVPGTQTRGSIRLHKALAWIHGPGMILTPVLGAMAFEQKNRGEKVHGIASTHGAVAIVTAGAYGLAIAAVSFRF